MVASIFISYAHTDRARAEQFAALFAAAGWSVWWDREITGGSHFDKATEEAIAAAKVIVVLWSRASVASHWVRAEAAWALAKDKLLSVKIDDVDPPLPFFHVPTIDLAGWDGAGDDPPLSRFLGEIAALVGESDVAASIFISYADEDHERAEKLASRLTAVGRSVWWRGKIRRGRRFDKVTEDAIGVAKVVVVLWSHASVVSHWVRAEAAWALARDKLLPVKIDDIDLPLQFFHVPTVDLAKWNGAVDDPALSRLLGEIAAQLDGSGVRAASENSPVEDLPVATVTAQATESLAVRSLPESGSPSPSGRSRSMLAPTGFWSYTTSDDKNSRGKLSQLRALLAAELQQHIGRLPEVHIFQDVAAIPPGRDWEKQIREALEACSFMIPLITPAFLQSEWCCREVALFRAREAALGRDDLIYPIHWLDTDHTDPNFSEDCYDKEILFFLRSRQWIDFRRLRLGSLHNRESHDKLAQISIAIRGALRRARLDDT